MDSVTFNSNWLCRLDYQEIHSLIGYEMFCVLFSDCLVKLFKRIESCKAQKCVLRPFHGCVVTLYAR